MRRGDRVELKMKKMLQADGKLDDREYICKVLKYDKSRENFHFDLQSGMLTELSLDAIYECKITSVDTQIKCSGRIKERYRGEEGCVLKFQIENGFYKINLKNVDKQIM